MNTLLAREMDVPLVTNRDLFVENDQVFVKRFAAVKG